jgi:tRNA threonylcarbamoyladenosine biosynthesis protein TsaB
MKLLAIDTASAQCSAALLVGEQLLERALPTQREHALLLLPMVDALLSEAGLTLRGLDGIAFGCGPGSFTGLRIAASVTQGLAAGANIPVLPISDLRTLAERARTAPASTAAVAAPAGGWLLACMDARMGELYSAVFADTGQPVGVAKDGEMLSSPAALVDDLSRILPPSARISAAAGLGLAAYPVIAQLVIDSSRCLAQAEPHAREVACLAASDLAAGAKWMDAADAQPIYLRNKVVKAPL